MGQLTEEQKLEIACAVEKRNFLTAMSIYTYHADCVLPLKMRLKAVINVFKEVGGELCDEDNLMIERLLSK